MNNSAQSEKEMAESGASSWQDTVFRDRVSVSNFARSYLEAES